MGEAGEGKNPTHQLKKLGRGRAQGRSATASTSRSATTQLGRAAVLQAGRRQPRDAIPARAPQGARRLPAGAARASRGAAVPELESSTRCSSPRRSRDVDDDGVRAHARPAAARQARRPRARADHPRRGAHVRHGRLVPPARHLRARRASSTSRSTPTSSCTTARTRRARSCRKASTRPARCRSWIAAGTATRPTACNMIPFYVFYSMFGFQRVGDLIWAAADMHGARLPARRDLGPHHAQRRGPAARRTATASHARHDPELHRLRPDVRVRARA